MKHSSCPVLFGQIGSLVLFKSSKSLNPVWWWFVKLFNFKLPLLWCYQLIQYNLQNYNYSLLQQSTWIIIINHVYAVYSCSFSSLHLPFINITCMAFQKVTMDPKLLLMSLMRTTTFIAVPVPTEQGWEGGSNHQKLKTEWVGLI